MDRLHNTLIAGCEPTRMKVLQTLGTGEFTAGRLAKIAGCSQPAMSHHLRILRMTGLVTFEKRDRHCHYSLSERGGHFLEFFAKLEG